MTRPGRLKASRGLTHAIVVFSRLRIAGLVFRAMTDPPDTECPVCHQTVWSWKRHLTSRLPGATWFWTRVFP